MVNSLFGGAPPASRQRPPGVTAIALLFGLSGIYLFVIGLLILHSPRLFSADAIIRIGRPLLTGLEVGGGSYVFLISGWLFVIIGLQLRELRNWARWAATLVCLYGMFLLIPIVSIAANNFGASLFWSGLGMIVRVVVVRQLWLEEVRDAFDRDVAA